MRTTAAILTFLLSMFCFCNAEAQPRIPLGSYLPTVVNWIKGGLQVDSLVQMKKYATSDTNKVAGWDADGNLVARTKVAIDQSIFILKSDTSRSGIVTTYYFVDSVYSSIITDIEGEHDSLFRNGGNSFGSTASLGTNDANHLDIKTNNTVRGRWTSGGNLLVGTTTDAGFKLDVNGTFRAIGNSTIRGTLTVDNITNSDLIQIVTTGGNPYLRFLDAGSFIADLKTTVAVPTVAGAGLSISDGGSGFLSFRAGKILASNGYIAITSGDAAGPAFLELNGSTNNFIRFIEAGAADRGIVGYADASNIMQFRTGGATSPTTGTLSMSLLNNGRVLLSQVPEYADNAAAILGGLAVGTIYRTGDILKIVH